MLINSGRARSMPSAEREGPETLFQAQVLNVRPGLQISPGYTDVHSSRSLALCLKEIFKIPILPSRFCLRLFPTLQKGKPELLELRKFLP